MIDAVAWIFLFLLGTCVGSFVNVQVLRFGYTERRESRSHCASCGTQLRWYDLIPLVSYLLLRGRCRYCGSAISTQYLLVEITVGILFVLVYVMARPSFDIFGGLALAGHLVFWTSLWAVFLYDLRHTLVPLPFVYAAVFGALIVRGLEAYVFLDTYPLLDAVYGALALGGFFAVISLATKGRGMGIGDAYVAAAVGCYLGLVLGLEAAVTGVWTGTILYGVLLMLTRLTLVPPKVRVTMKSELPFAPFLFLGAAIVAFGGFSPLLIIDQLLYGA